MTANDTIGQFFPADLEVVASVQGIAFATLDTRNSVEPINCLNYPVSILAVGRFTGLLPRHYAGGNFSVQVVYSAASVGTGSVNIGVAAAAMGPNFNVSATPITYSTTVIVSTSASTAGLLVYTTASVSVPAFVSGRMYSLEVSRQGQTDNMAGALQIYAIEIKEL